MEVSPISNSSWFDDELAFLFLPAQLWPLSKIHDFQWKPLKIGALLLYLPLPVASLPLGSCCP